MQRAVQRLRQVAGVPDDRKAGARLQHPRELAERRIVREPVQRLRDRDRVGGRVGHRQALGDAVEHLGAGRRRREHVAHAGDRLDRDDPQPALDERARELARPGRHVDDRGARPDAQRLQQPVDQRRRVLGTGAVVDVRRPVEAGGRRVQVHPQTNRGAISPIAWSRISRPSASSSVDDRQRRGDAERPAHLAQLDDVHVQPELEAARGHRGAELGRPAPSSSRSSTSSSALHAARGRGRRRRPRGGRRARAARCCSAAPFSRACAAMPSRSRTSMTVRPTDGDERVGHVRGEEEVARARRRAPRSRRSSRRRRAAARRRASWTA